jgi:four helix bundle protein
MNQWREEMKARTHRFSVAVILLLQTIPDRTDTRRVKDQLAGAASGLDLNWRAACRARSHKEFMAKLGTVLEEADEAEGCLDTIWDARISTTDDARRLRTESKELRAIFAKASATATRNEGALLARREGGMAGRQEFKVGRREGRKVKAGGWRP